MEKVKEFYRRKLPHIIPPGSIFFVTSRLYGSLPHSVITELKIKNDENAASLSLISDYAKKLEKSLEFQDEYFRLFDEALIKYSNGPYWLGEDNVTEIVKDALLYSRPAAR